MCLLDFIIYLALVSDNEDDSDNENEENDDD